MRDPVVGVVIPLGAIVDAAQTLMGIFLLEDGEEPVPVTPLFVAAMALGPRSVMKSYSLASDHQTLR